MATPEPPPTPESRDDVSATAGFSLAVAAEALYLINLMIVPGLAFLVLAGLWLRHRRTAPLLARCHLAQTFFASLEYYLPVLEGKIGVFGGYYQTDILNTDQFATAATARRRRASLTEAGMLFDPVPAVRFAADYGLIRDAYADGTTAWNWSLLGSVFFFF